MSREKTRVIVRGWQPSANDARTAEREFLALASALFPTGINVTYRAKMLGTGTDYWHRDCGGRDQYLLLWSNAEPTKVRYQRGDKWSRLRVARRDVILVDNLAAEHAGLGNYSPDRYLLRIMFTKEGE